MSEKLAIELRQAAAFEPAARALRALSKSASGAAAAGRRSDQIRLSALARAIAFPETAARLKELAAAIEAGSYAVAAEALGRRLLAEHIQQSH
jgi:anti-sigma28 factor (negative regulator of flagellin synthesis)